MYTSEVISDEIVLLGGSKERTSVADPPPGRPEPAPGPHSTAIGSSALLHLGYRQTRLYYCVPCARLTGSDDPSKAAIAALFAQSSCSSLKETKEISCYAKRSALVSTRTAAR